MVEIEGVLPVLSDEDANWPQHAADVGRAPLTLSSPGPSSSLAVSASHIPWAQITRLFQDARTPDLL
jgi:hypothetical protein